MPDGKLVGGGMPGPTLDVQVAAGSAARAIDVGATNAALPHTITAIRKCVTRPERTRASVGRQSSAYGLGLGEGDAEGDAAGEPLGEGLGDGDGEGSGVQPGLPGVSSTVCSTPVTSTSFCW
jgi:hypothetical protein